MGFIKKTEDLQKRELSRDEKDKIRDSGYRKAAEFLVLLGKEEAANVLKHLSEEEIEGITDEIARIKTIDNERAKKIFEEFGYLYKTKDLVARGGEEKAGEILIKAFGNEKGSSILKKILERTVPHPFTFLKDVEVEQVQLLLKNESAPVISVVIAHLEHGLAARLISEMPVSRQREIAKRIATMGKITPEIIRKTEEILREKLRQQGQVITREIDGKNALIQIIRHMGVGAENILLEEIEKADPELAEGLKKDLFSIDVLRRMRDKDLQAVLRDFNDKEIALILKAKDSDIRERILNGVSSRRRELIMNEYKTWGEVLKSEVEKATAEFLDYIKKKADSGAIVLLDREDEEYVS